MDRNRLLALVLCLLPFAAAAARAEGDAAAADEHTLREAGIATDDAGLREFFRRRTPDEALRLRVHTLVRRLGDRSFRAREEAAADLIRLGRVALPALRQARTDPDAEIARRAAHCLKRIEADPDPGLVRAAAGLLAVRKPAWAAESLLAYRAAADPEGETTSVEEALAAVACPNGRPEPVLVRALTDRDPARRAAAAEALCRAGAAARVPALGLLLHDPDFDTRLRAALAQARCGVREAVPVAIDGLGRAGDRDGQIEDLLYRLAGTQPPALPARADARRKREAWAAWWEANQARLSLTGLDHDPPPLGFTLVVLLDGNRVVEWDRDGKERWRIDRLAAPLDAQVLPGNRVLVAEFTTRRITERTFQGEVVWEKTVSENPLAAQRLANGNTFIVTHDQLLEVNRAGQEVFRYAKPGAVITTAVKLRSGRIGCVVGGNFRLLDAGGRLLKEFPVGAGVQTTSSLDVLPSGGVLVAEYGGGRVLEYDADGKLVWEASVRRPISVSRLPNEHILVSTQDGRVVELDRSRQIVWERTITGHPTRVRRR